jgi:hypothetical protein
MSEEITIERLERGLVVLTYIMSRDGPAVAPLFGRIERELAALRSQRAATERAQRLLENLGSPMHHNLPLTFRYNNRFNDDIFGTAISGC